MTVKKAIAIALLTTATLGLAIFGIKKGILKKPVTQTNAEETRTVLTYQNNFNTTFTPTNTTGVNRTFHFNGNYKYYTIYKDYTITYKFVITYEGQITYNTTNPSYAETIIYFGNERANGTNVNDDYPFTIETEEFNDLTTNIDFKLTNIEQNTTRGDSLNYTTVLTYNNNDYTYVKTQEPRADTLPSGFNWQTNVMGTYQATIINETIDQQAINDYTSGYSDGFQDGYDYALETITPDITNSNYTIKTLNYDRTKNKTYYTAEGYFNTNNPIPFNNNQTFTFNGKVNIEITNKEYQDSLYNNIDGYQLKITVDFESIKNITTNTELVQQNHTVSSALIYTENQPNGITIQLTQITLTAINMTANVSNENKLIVNSNFYTYYTGQTITTNNTAPSNTLILGIYNIANNINATTEILQEEINQAYQQGITEGNNTTEIIPIADTMLQILTMPFTFISQAFNVTLWPNTQYAFNFSNFIKGLLAISAVLFIIKVFTSGFAVFGQYNSHRNSNIKTNKPQKASKPTKTKE